jgi:FkbM family methyltransferase
MRPSATTAAPRRLPEPLRRHLAAVGELRSGEAELGLLRVLLGSGSGTFVDVGANLGTYSIIADLLGHRVVAFEPHPVVAGELRSTLPGQIVHELGLSNATGTARFYIPRTVDGSDISTRGSLDAGAHRDHEQREVVVVTCPLDDLDIDDVRLIKIDVEGHELQVLEGATATIRRERPCVVVEIEEHRAPGNIARIRAMFDELGYSGWYLDGRSLHPVDAFDVSRHQRLDAVPRFGQVRSSEYINNFLWMPRDARRSADAVRAAARRTRNLRVVPVVAGMARVRFRRLLRNDRAQHAAT